MAYIYKITNDLNGKVYIGKTLRTVRERWIEHCSDARKSYVNRPLYAAINKYGIEHFHIEEIEQCSVDDASEREMYWIEHYNSYGDGYNATAGGDGKPLADRSLIYTLWDQGKTEKEIKALTGYDIKTIIHALEDKDISAKDRSVRGHERLYKAVIMLDKDTREEIKAFPSIAEASRYIQKPDAYHHIPSVCRGKRKSAYGYGWKYAEDEA